MDSFYHKTSSAISGVINENSTVFVYNVSSNKLVGDPIATGITDENGNFSINMDEQAINTKLAIVAEDLNGNKSNHKIITVLRDRTAPILKLEDIYANSKEIVGTVNEEASILVSIGGMSYNAVSDQNNTFNIALDEYLAIKTRVNITVEDILGNKRIYNYTVKKTSVN